jgi:hypothetical protein
MHIPSPYTMKALHTQEVMNMHVEHCRERSVGPPASHYANVSTSALASWRSAVSKPSVNQP